MRFIGTFFQTVDPKGRITLPARFKRLLTPDDRDTVVMTAGRENCLLLYPLTEWAQLAERLDALPHSPERRNAIRSISDNTLELDVDAHGRVTIPREFLNRCSISREVALVGSLRYIEVWARSTYEEGREQRRSESSEILDQLF